jgi:hypothetical protein
MSGLACPASLGRGGVAGSARRGRVGASTSAASSSRTALVSTPQPPAALVAPRRRRRRGSVAASGCGVVFSAGLNNDDGRATTYTDVVDGGWDRGEEGGLVASLEELGATLGEALEGTPLGEAIDGAVRVDAAADAAAASAAAAASDADEYNLVPDAAGRGLTFTTYSKYFFQAGIVACL